MNLANFLELCKHKKFSHNADHCPIISATSVILFSVLIQCFVYIVLSSLLLRFQVLLCSHILNCFVFVRGIIYVIDSSAFQKELKDVAESVLCYNFTLAFICHWMSSSVHRCLNFFFKLYNVASPG